MSKTERRLKRIEERLDELEKGSLTLPPSQQAEKGSVEFPPEPEQIPEPDPGPFPEPVESFAGKIPQTFAGEIPQTFAGEPGLEQFGAPCEPKEGWDSMKSDPTVSNLSAERAEKLNETIQAIEEETVRDFEKEAYDLYQVSKDWKEVGEILGHKTPWFLSKRYEKRIKSED